MSLDRFLNLDWGTLSSLILDVLRRPTANLSAFFLLMGSVGLLLLILVIGAALVLLRRAQKHEDADREYGESSADQESPGEETDGVAAATESDAASVPGGGSTGAVRRRSWLAWVLVGALVVASVVVGAVYTGTNKVCVSSCHADDVVPKSSAHGTTSCVDCHELPGVRSIGALPERGLHLVASAAGSKYSYSPVASESCAACHEKEIAAKGSILSARFAIRMSHREPWAAGIACSRCHAITHGTSGVVEMDASVRMGVCVTCHDSKTASAQCSTCHVGDPSVARRPRGQMPEFPKVATITKDEINCYGCHGPAKCDKCHGLRMPHTQEFIAGGHARQAAFEGKQTCRRCHSRLFCAEGCHRVTQPHGTNAYWRVNHGLNQPYNSKCGCHSSFNTKFAKTGFCVLCHATRPAGSAPATTNPEIGAVSP